MTAQGHPRRIFQTAIERGKLLLAEATARELGRITLDESLALTALVAEKDPERRSRFAVRWLRRLLEEDESLTIEEATMAASGQTTSVRRLILGHAFIEVSGGPGRLSHHRAARTGLLISAVVSLRR